MEFALRKAGQDFTDELVTKKGKGLGTGRYSVKIWAVGKYVPTEQGPTSLQALHLKTAVPNVRINCDLEFCNIHVGTPADSQMYRLFQHKMPQLALLGFQIF